jgi:hypothetical protein
MPTAQLGSAAPCDSAPAAGKASFRNSAEPTPRPIERKIVAAQARRAVPATRWREASSLRPTVSVRPGTRTIKPLRVTMLLETSAQREAASTARAVVRKAARLSKTRAALRRLPTRSASRPVASPARVEQTRSPGPPPKKHAAVPAARAKAGTMVQRG